MLFDLDIIEGFVWKNYALENDPMISTKRSSAGYIAQEIERRLHGQ